MKRAIVTGASSGIGAAIAKELCLRDVEVIAVARDKVKLGRIKKSLPEAKRANFKAIVADIRKAECVTKMLKSSRPLGTIDLLVNNAGVGVAKSFEEHTPAEIENIISTNLVGVITLTKGILNGRDKSRSSHIVFVTSLAGKIGFPDLSVYSATKFALEGLAESLRVEYQDKPVKISVLRPGVTDTNFFSTAGMEDQAEPKSRPINSPSYVANVLLDNMGKPEVVVGGDKYFLRLLPIIPFNKRFLFLKLTNRLGKRG